MIKQLNLDWQTASTLCRAACDFAAEQKLSICVWVLDRHGNPLAMQRLNEAPLASTEIARRKAWTAVSFGFATDQWPQRLKDQPYLLNSLSQQADMAMFGGGLPINSETSWLELLAFQALLNNRIWNAPGAHLAVYS